MVERQLVVGEEHAVYRLQVKVEAHSPAKRGAAEQLARHREARRRVSEWRAARQSRRTSGGGSAPLSSGQLDDLHDVVGREWLCRLRQRWGALQSENGSEP